MRLPKYVKIHWSDDGIWMSGTMSHKDEVRAVIKALKILLPFVDEPDFVPPAAHSLSMAMDTIYVDR